VFFAVAVTLAKTLAVAVTVASAKTLAVAVTVAFAVLPTTPDITGPVTDTFLRVEEKVSWTFELVSDSVGALAEYFAVGVGRISVIFHSGLTSVDGATFIGLDAH
jgi:hypothetical protein